MANDTSTASASDVSSAAGATVTPDEVRSGWEGYTAFGVRTWTPCTRELARPTFDILRTKVAGIKLFWFDDYLRETERSALLRRLYPEKT